MDENRKRYKCKETFCLDFVDEHDAIVFDGLQIKEDEIFELTGINNSGEPFCGKYELENTMKQIRIPEYTLGRYFEEICKDKKP